MPFGEEPFLEKPQPPTEREPEDATTWRIISEHDDMNEAERRLRHILGSPVYYDAEGRSVRPSRGVKPRWSMPPTDGG